MKPQTQKQTQEEKLKEEIEKLKVIFGNATIKYTEDWKNLEEDDYPKWYVLEFGKYCYTQAKQEVLGEVMKIIDKWWNKKLEGRKGRFTLEDLKKKLEELGEK